MGLQEGHVHVLGGFCPGRTLHVSHTDISQVPRYLSQTDNQIRQDALSPYLGSPGSSKHHHDQTIGAVHV